MNAISRESEVYKTWAFLICVGLHAAVVINLWYTHKLTPRYIVLMCEDLFQ
jgi:hypothetical protein